MKKPGHQIKPMNPLEAESPFTPPDGQLYGIPINY